VPEDSATLATYAVSEPDISQSLIVGVYL